jgi:hypothetical protein
MNAPVEALVCAIQHIVARPSTDGDSDVAVLESIAATLHWATAEEKAAFELEAKKLCCPELPENLRL